MKVDIKNPDSPSQVAELQNLLRTTHPAGEDVAIALFIALIIFFENRPGKLHDHLQNYYIHGTGCHNPISEKTGKIMWRIWRHEVTIGCNDTTLVIKQEITQGGYLKATLKTGTVEQTITADIFRKKDDTTIAKSDFVTGTDPITIMKKLESFLKEPLEILAEIVNPSAKI